MWDKWVSIIDALILHLFVLGVIFLSMEGVTFPSPSAFLFEQNRNEATVEKPLVDENQVLTEIDRLKQQEAEKVRQQASFENKKKEYEQILVQDQERLKQLRQELKREEQELAKIRVSD